MSERKGLKNWLGDFKDKKESEIKFEDLEGAKKALSEILKDLKRPNDADVEKMKEIDRLGSQLIEESYTAKRGATRGKGKIVYEINGVEYRGTSDFSFDLGAKQLSVTVDENTKDEATFCESKPVNALFFMDQNGNEHEVDKNGELIPGLKVFDAEPATITRNHPESTPSESSPRTIKSIDETVEAINRSREKYAARVNENIKACSAAGWTITGDEDEKNTKQISIMKSEQLGYTEVLGDKNDGLTKDLVVSDCAGNDIEIDKDGNIPLHGSKDWLQKWRLSILGKPPARVYSSQEVCDLINEASMEYTAEPDGGKVRIFNHEMSVTYTPEYIMSNKKLFFGAEEEKKPSEYTAQEVCDLINESNSDYFADIEILEGQALIRVINQRNGDICSLRTAETIVNYYSYFYEQKEKKKPNPILSMYDLAAD
jgi:hypothetical protein